MKTHRLILASTLSIFLSATARADLKWDQTAVELHPSITDKQAIGHFKYENTGKEPVHFKSVHASCGCTTAQTQKEEVKPGEKGEITATFNIGDRTGTQVKTITVQTDNPDPTKATTMLKLTAVIPQALEITPTFLFWQDKEPAKAKSIMVKANKDFPVKGIKATTPTKEFDVKVNKIGKGEYKIDVTPQDMSHMSAATITIQPEDTNKMYYANVRIMGPPMSPAPMGNVGVPTPASAPVKNGTPPMPATNSGANGAAPPPTPVNSSNNSAPPTPVQNSAGSTSPAPTPQQ